MGDLRFELRSPTFSPERSARRELFFARLPFLWKEKAGPEAGRIPDYPNPPSRRRKKLYWLSCLKNDVFGFKELPSVFPQGPRRDSVKEIF